MTHLRTFGKFWYDFIVGDDWRDAAGAAIAIALSFVAAHHGANLWWLLPVTVTALLTISVRRALGTPRYPDSQQGGSTYTWRRMSEA